MDIVVIILCLFLMLLVPLAFVSRVIVRSWCKSLMIKRLQKLENMLCDRSIRRSDIFSFLDSRECECLYEIKGFNSILSNIESGHRERASYMTTRTLLMLKSNRLLNGIRGGMFKEMLCLLSNKE